jgi:hypothetical protein
MATAAAPEVGRLEEVKRRRQMEEVKAPEMFQFSDQHRTLSGVFIDIAQVTVRGKDTIQYTLQDDFGKRFTFLATYDLQRKIQAAHAGHWMDITYEGEDSSVQTQGSPLRKFKVLVSRDKEPGF